MCKSLVPIFCFVVLGFTALLSPKVLKAQYCDFHGPIGSYLAQCCNSQYYNYTIGCEHLDDSGCNPYSTTQFCAELDDGTECDVAVAADCSSAPVARVLLPKAQDDSHLALKADGKSLQSVRGSRDVAEETIGRLRSGHAHICGDNSVLLAWLETKLSPTAARFIKTSSAAGGY